MRRCHDPKLLFVGARLASVPHDANPRGDTVDTRADYLPAGIQPLPMADAESACI